MVHINFLLNIIRCRYLVTFTYILRLVLNLNDVITTVVSHYSANEILECFI